jgi:hypothetical protein
MSMVNNDQNASYCQLFCGMINTIKEQLTNRFSETLMLKFLSPLEFVNFIDTYLGIFQRLCMRRD